MRLSPPLRFSKWPLTSLTIRKAITGAIVENYAISAQRPPLALRLLTGVK
ncbi:MAG: hypothetical protein QW680_13420 [Pyrobaculum sp.]